MERTNQGGSVLSFVIIGVILASVLVGSVYLVNRQTAQPVPRPPVVQEPQKPIDNKQQTPPPAEPGNDKPNSPPNQSAPVAGAPSSSATELPVTGVTETFGSLIVLGLLSAIVVSYVRSRRPQLSL